MYLLILGFTQALKLPAIFDTASIIQALCVFPLRLGLISDLISRCISSSDHNQPFINFSVSSSLAADQFDKSTGPDTRAMPSNFTGTTQLPKRHLFTHLRVCVANAAW